MRIIAVANQKGGCGKTTVVINLAACLAREGQRTLAVDLDPQGHCALGLAVPEEQIEVSVADLLTIPDDEPTPDYSRAIWQISSNFDLIPARTDLSQLEQRLAGVDRRERRLRRGLESLAEKYDYIVVDSPPTIGFLTQSILYAADEIIVPVDTGYFSLHGLSKQLETVRDLRLNWDRELTVRILANLYDVRTKLGREILAELRKRHSDAMFSSFVNFNTKLKESTSVGQPITEYDPASPGCRDFVRLARELISMNGNAARPTLPAYGALDSNESALPVLQSASAPVRSPINVPSPETPQPKQVTRIDREEPARVAASYEDYSTTRERESTDASESREYATPGQAVATATVQRQTLQPDPSLLARADALAANASKLLATTESLLGPGRRTTEQPREQASFDHAATQKKIDLIYGPSAVEEGVIFTVRAFGANTVRLAGDFNGWNPDRGPMNRLREDTFQLRLPLAPGRYRYRYVIDGQWQQDPANAMMEVNPFGEMNSIVVVS